MQRPSLQYFPLRCTINEQSVEKGSGGTEPRSQGTQVLFRMVAHSTGGVFNTSTVTDVPLLDVSNLSVHYGNRCLLSNISFQLLQNEVLFVRGPTGTGKSRLCRALAHIDRGFAGKVLLQGKTAQEVGFSRWRKNVCYISDTPPPLTCTGEEAFRRLLSFESRSVPPGRCASQVTYFREIAEQLGVSAETLQRPFTVLSAGERQRVSLSWGIALDPLVLLLDEPTSHLDAVAAGKFEQLVECVHASVVR